MSAEQALSVPTIKVNNDVVAIVPNTLVTVSGKGETKVRAASVGGGKAVTVHGQDAEMMYSTVKFSLMNTAENLTRVRNWQALVASNRIEVLQRGIGDNDDYNEAYNHMSVTNDPENNLSADGVIAVECAGDPLE